MLGISLLALAIVVGYFEGSAKASWPIVHATALAFLLVSNFIASLSFYTSDSGTWIITYFTGLLATGSASILVHVLPFYLAYLIVARIKSLTKRSSRNKRYSDH